MAQLVKNPPAVQETWARSLCWEDPLEKGKATHSSICPGEFHGLYSPRDHKESDTTKRLSLSPKIPNLQCLATVAIFLLALSYDMSLQVDTPKDPKVFRVISKVAPHNFWMHMFLQHCHVNVHSLYSYKTQHFPLNSKLCSPNLYIKSLLEVLIPSFLFMGHHIHG